MGYKALEIQQEYNERMIRLAKNLLMDIVSKRIDKGIYDEDPDGHYSIEPSDPDLTIMVWVQDTYSLDTYPENRRIKEICIEDAVYVVLGNGDEVEEEIYLRALPMESIIDICCDLEDIYDEEVGDDE